MKKTVLMAALSVFSLSLLGCGGGEMVGENSPTYSMTPLLDDNIRKVVFTGTVQCEDKQNRNVILTVEIVDRTNGDALFTVSFNDEVVQDGVAGIFREVRNRSVVVFMDPFTVEYSSNGRHYTNQFVFPSKVLASTLLYSGDTSVGVTLNPPPQNMCKLLWTEEEEDLDAAAGDASSGKAVQFTDLRTE